GDSKISNPRFSGAAGVGAGVAAATAAEIVASCAFPNFWPNPAAWPDPAKNLADTVLGVLFKPGTPLFSASRLSATLPISRRVPMVIRLFTQKFVFIFLLTRVRPYGSPVPEP